MIQDEQELFVDSPWDCRGLDPFRDDPVETNNISLVKDKSEDVGCTLITIKIVLAPVESALRCPAKKNSCAVKHWLAGRGSTNLKVHNTLIFNRICCCYGGN